MKIKVFSTAKIKTYKELMAPENWGKDTPQPKEGEITGRGAQMLLEATEIYRQEK